MHLICNVAPLVGAWIERSNTALKALGVFVAPLVGAWIERMPLDEFMRNARSLLL